MLNFKAFTEATEINNKPGSIKVVVFQGRFQPPTKAHIGIISKEKLPVRVFVIKGSKTDPKKSPFSFETRKKILEKALRAEGINFKIYEQATGFVGEFVNTLRDHNEEPVLFYCGSDRINTYERQVRDYGPEMNLKMEIKEIPRTGEDISATKVRDSLKNNKFGDFKTMMHQTSWSMFKDLQDEMGVLNEAVYQGNMGVMELFKFYDKASSDEIDEMEIILQKNDWSAFRKLIHKVLGVLLK